MLNVLSGLRDLRAPLTAGLLWMATLWVPLHEELERQAKRDTLLRDATQTLGGLGSTTSIAAVSFIAYLIGIVAVAPGSPLRVVRVDIQSMRPG